MQANGLLINRLNANDAGNKILKGYVDWAAVEAVPAIFYASRCKDPAKQVETVPHTPMAGRHSNSKQTSTRGKRTIGYIVILKLGDGT